MFDLESDPRLPDPKGKGDKRCRRNHGNDERQDVAFAGTASAFNVAMYKGADPHADGAGDRSGDEPSEEERPMLATG